MTLLLLNAVSPIDVFNQSDIFGKVLIVCLLLLSIFAWFLMVHKWLEFKEAQKKIKSVNSICRQYFLNQISFVKQKTGSLAIMYVEGHKHLAMLQQNNKTDVIEIKNSLKEHLENIADQQFNLYENHMGLLSTIVSASPFFGLLGTVWGVMIAFAGMAEAQNASLNAIAPGVAGALLTTVIGLLVAIPSLIGYNLLTQSLRNINASFDEFIDRFVSEIGKDEQEKE